MFHYALIRPYSLLALLLSACVCGKILNVSYVMSSVVEKVVCICEYVYVYIDSRHVAVSFGLYAARDMSDSSENVCAD